MSEEIKDITLIEAYLNNELKAEQKQAVEERRNNDPDFAQLMEDMEVVFEGTRSAFREDIEAQLKGLEADLPPVEIDEAALLMDDVPHSVKDDQKAQKAGSGRWSIRKWLYAAAVLIPLVFLMVRWLQVPASVSLHEEIFAANFQAYPAIGVLRSSQTGLKKQAFDLYADEEYAKASSKLLQLWETQQDTISLFYAGISELASGNSDTAIKHFDRFKQVSSTLMEQATWYTALGFLQKGEMEKVRKIEKDLNTGQYKNKLQEILNKFESD